MPKWLKDKKPQGFINAKAETIFEKPSFKKAIQERRCLIPADGFYEWSHDKDKIPYRFTLKDESIYCYAGIWESWQDKETETTTFSILTISANELIKPIHDRMPVILPRKSESIWIDTQRPQRDIDLLLKSYPADQMKSYRVSSFVNSPRHNGPEIIQPLNEII